MSRVMEFLLMHRPPITISDAYMRVNPSLEKKRVCEKNADKEILTKSIEKSTHSFTGPHRVRRKSVHFADTKGLDLVTMHSHEEEEARVSREWTPTIQTRRDRLRMVDFLEQFETKADFLEHLQSQKVYLENVYFLWEQQRLTVGGTVRMHNLAIEKMVVIRHSVDKWENSFDEFALYKSTQYQKMESFGIEIDTFTFQLSPITTDPDVDEVALELAVCYTVCGQEFWDNNGGENYQVVMTRRPSNGILKDTTYERSVEVDIPCIDWPCAIV